MIYILFLGCAGAMLVCANLADRFVAQQCRIDALESAVDHLSTQIILMRAAQVTDTGEIEND